MTPAGLDNSHIGLTRMRPLVAHRAGTSYIPSGPPHGLSAGRRDDCHVVPPRRGAQ